MGCGASIYDEFWYFGGDSSNTRRQVSRKPNEDLSYATYTYEFLKLSKIIGCKLTRQADMNFDFRAGSCNTFMHPEPMILLCFGDQSEKQCHTLVKNIIQLLKTYS